MGRLKPREGSDLPKVNGSSIWISLLCSRLLLRSFGKVIPCLPGHGKECKSGEPWLYLRRKSLGSHPGSEVFPSKKEPLWEVSLLLQPLDILVSGGGWGGAADILVKASPGDQVLI